MPAKPVPDGYATVSPMLITADPEALLRFLEGAFDCERLNYIRKADGGLMACDLRIGSASLSVCGAGGNMPAYQAVLYVYVPDVDQAYARAVAAGGTSLQEPQDEAHGDRMGGCADPAGNQWWIATRLEDLSNEEAERRMNQAPQGGAAS